MLEGFRILDLTWVLGGPFAGQTLAQLGADVIKIEPLRGDLARQVSRHATEFEGDPAFFLSVNRGKRSVAIDLAQPEGRAVLHDLARSADGMLYGFAPRVPAKLGLDKATLLAVNPRLAIAQMIGIHDEPPFADAPAFDLVVQAMSGLMSITGPKDGPPVRVGYQVADLAGGLYLALACLGAMLKAQKTGHGDLVQISLLDCQLALLTWQAQNYFVSGETPTANGARHSVIAPSDIYQCLDGRFIAISPTGQEFWTAFCDAIGRSDLARDPRFATPKERIAHVDALTAVLDGVFRARSSEAWNAALFAARVPAAPVNDVATALAQPAAVARHMTEDVTHPASGRRLRFLGNPFKYGGASPLRYPSPLGADTRTVLADLCGYSDARIDALVNHSIVGEGATA